LKKDDIVAWKSVLFLLKKCTSLKADMMEKRREKEKEA